MGLSMPPKDTGLTLIVLAEIALIKLEAAGAPMFFTAITEALAAPDISVLDLDHRSLMMVMNVWAERWRILKYGLLHGDEDLAMPPVGLEIRLLDLAPMNTKMHSARALFIVGDELISWHGGLTEYALDRDLAAALSKFVAMKVAA